MDITLQKYLPMLLQGTGATLAMVGITTIFSYLIGLPMGVLLRVTDQGGILENKTFNSVFGWIINILRSLPFIILMVFVIPFTRLLIGKSIGTAAACVPLIIGAAPFVARLVESSLAEIDNGVIEAAKCMGATNWQIICCVMLCESVPSLVRGLSISTITIIGYSAMAGTVGGGGLGDIAIRYGLHRYEPKVMWITMLLLIMIVCLIQILFDHLAVRLDKRNR